MTTVSVRIDEELVSAARSAAKAEFRTVQGQVEFWAKVGRAALDNPDLPASFIAESLMSMAESHDDALPFVPARQARHELGAPADQAICQSLQKTPRQHGWGGGFRDHRGFH